MRRPRQDERLPRYMSIAARLARDFREQFFAKQIRIARREIFPICTWHPRNRRSAMRAKSGRDGFVIHLWAPGFRRQPAQTARQMEQASGKA